MGVDGLWHVRLKVLSVAMTWRLWSHWGNWMREAAVRLLSEIDITPTVHNRILHLNEEEFFILLSWIIRCYVVVSGLQSVSSNIELQWQLCKILYSYTEIGEGVRPRTMKIFPWATCVSSKVRVSPSRGVAWDILTVDVGSICASWQQSITCISAATGMWPLTMTRGLSHFWWA